LGHGEVFHHIVEGHAVAVQDRYSSRRRSAVYNASQIFTTATGTRTGIVDCPNGTHFLSKSC